MSYYSDLALDYSAEDAELDRRDGLTPPAMPSASPTCFICGELPSGVTLRVGGESFRICRPCFNAGYQDNEANQAAWEADIDEAALTPAELYRAERDRQRSFRCCQCGGPALAEFDWHRPLCAACAVAAEHARTAQ